MKLMLNKSVWFRVMLTFKFPFKSPRDKQKISKRSEALVPLIWGSPNHFQERNSKLKGYFAVTLMVQKASNLYKPLGPCSMGMALPMS